MRPISPVARGLMTATAVLGLMVTTGASEPAAAAPGASTPSSCRPAPNFVGLKLRGARLLARRCHSPITYLIEVPSPSAPGTVISQSQPEGGNRLVVSTGPLTNSFTVLPGATSPPVESECTATLTLDEDGNARPLTCPGGHVNAEAWDYFESGHLPILSLPRDRTTCQITPYLTAGFADSAPIDDSAATLASAYNGWNLPSGLIADAVVDGTVAGGIPDHCPPATASYMVSPVTATGRLAYGYAVGTSVRGRCTAAGTIAGSLACANRHYAFAACWALRSKRPGGAAICLADAGAIYTTQFATPHRLAPTPVGTSRLWVLVTAIGSCTRMARPAVTATGQAVQFDCTESTAGRGLYLAGNVDQDGAQWTATTVRRQGARYRTVGSVVVSQAIFATG